MYPSTVLVVSIWILFYCHTWPTWNSTFLTFFSTNFFCFRFFSESKFLFDQESFCEPNWFGPDIYFGPNVLFDQFFLTFLHQLIIWIKDIFYPNVFFDLQFLQAQIFWDLKFFWPRCFIKTKLLFDTKYFFRQHAASIYGFVR